MKILSDICLNYVDGPIDEYDKIGIIIKHFQWSDDEINKIADICSKSNMEMRKYLLLRVCHKYFNASLHNNNIYYHQYVPIGLKKMFALCGGAKKSKYDITNLIGFGLFLSRAIMHGESEFVTTLLFDSYYNYIETISEIDLEYIIVCVHFVYNHIKTYLEILKITKKIYRNDPLISSCLTTYEQNMGFDKQENIVSFYRLFYALVSSHKILNFNWIAYDEMKCELFKE